MNPTNVQWIFDFVLTAILAYLAFRKAPKERIDLDANASKNYAESARIAGEERLKAEQERQKVQQELQVIREEYDKRIAILEHKKYRVVVEFEIGDPPSVGRVQVEPIIDMTPITSFRE